MRYIFQLICCLSLAPVIGFSQSAPLVIGTSDTLFSEILSEKRTVNISLPEGYNPNDTVHYPVVYLLDGGMEEDFIHILGLYRFNSTSWNSITPPAIIVGITNINRLRDMTFPTSDTAYLNKYPNSGHADRFIRFIQSELIPFINENYKTNQTRTLIGESLAGLLTTEILLQRPDLFTQYMIVSPSLWWNNRSILNSATENLAKAVQHHPITVFLAVGKEGLTPGANPKLMNEDVIALRDKLKTVAGLKIHYDYLKDKNHANVLHQAVYNALLEFSKLP